MSGHQNRLSRLWQELKRRRVIHVITVYATASFAIIEVIGNLTEPLNLPTSLSTIVIILLAVGFPLAIILSWLYNLTSGTFERTKPLDETKEEIKPVVVPNAWKIATYVSFVVIVGLVAFNIITRGNVIKPGSIQSLVVLPFNNYTGQDSLDWFVSGMHSSLIQDIGTVGGLRIIGETSSNAFKNVNLQVTEIASELNVDAVIEADVLCLGEDTVCFQTRLIKSGREEEQLWIADYKVPRNQILNWYKGVTKQIAKEINIKLTAEEEQFLTKSRTIDREVYDAYLKGHQYLDDISLESLNKAREYLSIAIEKDPDWVPLYSSLAMVWMSLAQNSFESPSVAYQKAYECLDKALELDPDHADTRFLIAHTSWLNKWDWTKAEREFLKAIAGNPNDVWYRMWYAHLLSCLQRHDEALIQAQLASDLDPLNPFLQTMFSVVLGNAGNCEAAIANLEKVLAVDEENFIANIVLSCEAFLCGDYAKVIEGDKHVLQAYSRGQFDEDAFKEIERIFDEQGFSAAYEQELGQWEVLANKGFVAPIDMSVMYAKGNKQEKAMDLIEKGYEIRDPNMPYITSKMYPYDSLYDNPRFIDIVQKMNLPLPKSD
jgi:TolB-like protein/Tfp pilus assembly protein PilF